MKLTRTSNTAGLVAAATLTLLLLLATPAQAAPVPGGIDALAKFFGSMAAWFHTGHWPIKRSRAPAADRLDVARSYPTVSGTAPHARSTTSADLYDYTISQPADQAVHASEADESVGAASGPAAFDPADSALPGALAAVAGQSTAMQNPYGVNVPGTGGAGDSAYHVSLDRSTGTVTVSVPVGELVGRGEGA